MIIRACVVYVRRRTTAGLLADYHLVATVVWMVMIPVSILTGIWHSVGFVTLLSLWALVATEWSAWQGSRAELKAEQIEEES